MTDLENRVKKLEFDLQKEKHIEHHHHVHHTEEHDKEDTTSGWSDTGLSEIEKSNDTVFTKKTILAHELYAQPKVTQKLIDDPRIDAVYIPLPTTMHLEWIKKSAQAGKRYILCKNQLQQLPKN